MQFPEHLDEGIIHAWLDGQLPPADAASLEAHLRECPDCAARVAEERGYLAGASGILSALDAGFSTGDGPANGGREADDGIVPIAAAAPARVRRARRWVMPGAAAATLVVAIGTSMVMRGGGDRAAREAVMSVSAVRARPADGAGSSSSAAGFGTAASAAARREAPSGALPPVVPSSPAERSARRDLANAQAVAPEQTTANAEERTQALRVAATPAAPPAVSPAPAPAAAADVAVGGAAGGLQGRAPGVALQKSADTAVRAERIVAARRATAPAPVAQAPGLTITGRVTNEDAAPVAGASVGLRGTTIVAVTDADGRYSFAVPARIADSGVVVARRIGFQPEAAPVPLGEQGTLTVNLALRSQATQLQEVVVTGVDAVAASRAAATETGAFVGCWTVQRPPAGIPARVRLDSAVYDARALPGGRRVYRVLGADGAAAAVLGGWRPAAAPGAATRVVLFPARAANLARGARDVATDLAGDTVSVRRVECRR